MKAELFYGARNSTRVEDNLRLLARFFGMFDSVAFDDECAVHYGLLRANLRRAGTPIGGNDMMIAAMAVAHDLTLATRNQAEFQRVGGLRLEEW
ncbi:MAG: type II toxin-antitoxin system VapC family toxin [Planctomycetes bacterium]|nr:type II toxin-antitoxin system VapC family toxin [Planctomycetota bacterium]